MPAKSWYLTATTANSWRTVDESTQAAATSSDGWTVSTGSTNDSEYFVGVQRAAATFTGTSVPDGTLDTSNKDAFRTTNALCGDFASGNWVFDFVLRATVANSQAGRIRFRLIKADADGSNAVEITAGVQTASTVTLTATGTDFDSTLTVNPGAFSIYGQYLFIQVAFERTGAGSMTTNDVVWRTGSSASLGTRLTSATFTEVAPPATQRAAQHQSQVRASGLATAIVSAAMVGNLLTSTLGVTPAKSGSSEQPRPVIARVVPQRFDPVNLLLTTLAVVSGGDASTTDQQTLIASVAPSRQRFDPPNLLVTTLGTPVTPSPFTQTAWPNPYTRPSRLDIATSIKPGEADAASAAPFAQIEWSNPTRRPGAVRELADLPVPLTLRSATAATLPVGRQLDWPNPRGGTGLHVGRVAADPQTTVFVVAVSSPFAQTTWPNPPARTSRLDVQVSTKPGEADAVVAGTPFVPMMWPTPPAIQRLLPATTQASPQALLLATPPAFPPSRIVAWPNPTRPAGRLDISTTVKPGEADAVAPSATPFAQSAWPNPQARRARLDVSTSIKPGEADQVAPGDPFRPIAWPNPTLKPKARQFHTLDGVARLLVDFRAADLDDVFPNPIGRRAPLQRAESANLLLTTLAGAPAPVPFHQTDWPVVRSRPVAQQTVSTPDVLALRSQDPYRPAEWPNPTRAVVARPGHPSPNLLESTLAPVQTAAPFQQSDWTVARPRPSAQYPASTANLLPLLNAVPFRPVDAPNPARRAVAVDTAVQNLLEATLAPVVVSAAPFSQAEWRNPVGPRATQSPAHAVNVLTTTLAAPVAPPFAQSEWPNPVRARVGVHQGQASGVLVETTLAPRPQFAQTEWPNPTLPRRGALTWTHERPFYYEDPGPDVTPDVIIRVRPSVAIIQVRPNPGTVEE